MFPANLMIRERSATGQSCVHWRAEWPDDEYARAAEAVEHRCPVEGRRERFRDQPPRCRSAGPPPQQRPCCSAGAPNLKAMPCRAEYAFVHRRLLLDVARDVVERRLVFAEEMT
jgi:hypothetical protein